MPDYSGFQPRRPHSLKALTSVYEAAAGDGSPGRFALKIFHPPPSTSIRRTYAIEGWLLAAERQREAAGKGGAVLPVVACGRCAEGAFAVMPWQAAGFEAIAESVESKGDLLRALAERLLAALTAWEAQYGGPHGNLRASNVFLSKSGPLPGTTMLLSDPAFMPGGKADAARGRDLAAVGAILAQVVRRRSSVGWPIEDAPEWHRLGRAGKGWLAFCNFLLNPHPAADELTLENARRHLEKIPRDARPVRNAVLATSTVLVLAAAGVFGYARFGDPQGMPHRLRVLAETTGNPRAFRAEVTPDWAKLCRAWETWLDDVRRNQERWNRTTDLWAADDPLRAALAEFQAAAPELLPGALVPEAAGETRLRVLAEAPDAIRRQLLRGTVAERVTEAWNRIDQLARALERWPRWGEARQLVGILEARGFTRTATALRTRLPPAPGPAGAAVDAAALVKVFNDASLDDAGLLPLLSRWGEYSRLAAAMEASGDRVQKAMPRLALAPLTDRAELGDFADLLTAPVAELRRRRGLFLDAAVVRERFLKESPLMSATAPVTDEDLPRWEQELAQYSRVPAAEDPRARPEVDAQVSRMTASAGDLEKEAPLGDGGGVALLSRADFDREAARLGGDLKALRSREIVRRDLPEITQEADALTKALRGLEQRVEATLALLRPDIWLRRVGEEAGTLAATRQRWKTWQQTALRGITAAALERDRARFRALRQQERTLRDWIDGLEGRDGFGGITAPDFSALAPATVEALNQLAAARRELAATAVAAAATWRDGLPATAWAAEDAKVKAPLASHAAWVAALPAVGGDLEKLGTMLETGFGWTEGIGDTYARLGRVEGLETLAGAPGKALAEASRLAHLVEGADRATLVAAAQGGSLSTKLTVWRQLGRMTDWPAGADELDVDGGMVAALRDGIARTVKDETRRGALQDELARETKTRWNLAARHAARDPRQLPAVFERMDRYQIRTADLEAPVAYNFSLWRLKQSDWSETDLGRLRTRRDEFVAAVRSLGVTNQPAVADFMRSLSAVDLTVDPNLKPAASPRVAGWKEELGDGGLRVSATWQSGERKVSMDFLLVQPTDDTPPFYLSEREVAVGEFLDLVAARPDGRAVLDVMPQWTRADTLSKPWNKPMAWRPRADFRGLELNPTWIYLPDAQVKSLLEDQDLRARSPALVPAVTERPTVRSPLQQIPPEAARVLVERLMGARLPRPNEWRAVVKAAGNPEAGHFRGAKFAELWNFLEAYREGGQIVRWRPNEGVYLPLVEQAGGGLRRPLADDGKARDGTRDGPLWLAPVDDGPKTSGFVNLVGNVWVYLYDDAAKQFYVAGGSALSPPAVAAAEPLKVEAGGLVGARRVTEGFSDVGVRPAFDAPPGFRERYKLLLLVREQAFLTW